MQIVVADDHPVVLMGIRALLGGLGENFQVVGEATGGRALLALLARQPCDLLITDFSMPDEQGGLDGLPLLQRLRREHPQLPIVVLTMVHNPVLVRGMLAAGAGGVVDKASLMRELALAIRAVSAGRRHLSEALREAALLPSPGASDDAQVQPLPVALSRREAEVVRLFANGLSVTQIAEHLHRSVKTVSQQKNDAMRKLGLQGNSQLYEYARSAGLVS